MEPCYQRHYMQLSRSMMDQALDASSSTGMGTKGGIATS